MAEQVTFGIGIGEIFKEGFKGWKSNIIPLTAAGIVPLAVATGFSLYAQRFTVDGATQVQSLNWFIFNFIGWVIAGTLAYPWYFYALRAADGEKIAFGEPFETPNRFFQQLVGSLFFFAGFLFGIRFFLIPALFVLIFYAFYGYLIAEGKSGLIALGTSVRMGEKRRFGLLAVALVFLLFNFFGVIPGAALGQPALALIVSTLGLLITTSITLVGGASVYRVMRGFLNE